MRLPENGEFASRPRRKGKATLLGVGFDASDEHTRITKGENFHLVGGSEETHDRMTETAVKLNEKLHSKGKTLEELSKDEFTDILRDASET
ncbi:MAG: hypothetical protein GXP32_03555 [Kiritimatiellaeota bacterium]|nr:hypothetical protein [Kiritimatiellota bacterium]